MSSLVSLNPSAVRSSHVNLSTAVGSRIHATRGSFSGGKLRPGGGPVLAFGALGGFGALFCHDGGVSLVVGMGALACINGLCGRGGPRCT